MRKALSDIIPGSVTFCNEIPKEYVEHDLYNNLVHNDDPDEMGYKMMPRVGAFEVSYKGFVSHSINVLI